MFKQIYSFFLSIKVDFDRIVDHTFRYFTGLPLARRSVITPQIFLGGQYGTDSIAKLKSLGVTAIVNMRGESITEKVKKLEVNILHLPIKDKEAPTIEQLKEGSKFIEKEVKKGGKVYIHCHWGEERGPTMAIAYLISSGLTFDDAFNQVKKVRTFIKPTVSQIERLKEFELEVSKLRRPKIDGDK